MTNQFPKTAVSLVDDLLTVYCENSTSEEPLICQKIRHEAMKHPKAHWISGPIVGTFLELLVSLTNSTRVLDVGTFLGYSAAYMASARPDVKVTSLEQDPTLAAQAQALLATSKLATQIDVIVTEALRWLLATDHPAFDLIFFDSGRRNVMALYEPLIWLLKKGGILVMDNACLKRRVLSPKHPWEGETISFNARISQDPMLLATLLPIRDGVLLAQKL